METKPSKIIEIGVTTVVVSAITRVWIEYNDNHATLQVGLVCGQTVTARGDVQTIERLDAAVAVAIEAG